MIPVAFSQQTQMVQMKLLEYFIIRPYKHVFEQHYKCQRIKNGLCSFQQIQLVFGLFLMEILSSVVFNLGFTIIRKEQLVNVGKKKKMILKEIAETRNKLAKIYCLKEYLPVVFEENNWQIRCLPATFSVPV